MTALPPDVRKWLCPSVLGGPKFGAAPQAGGIAPNLKDRLPAGHSHRRTSDGEAVVIASQSYEYLPGE
jgi:hypothetical protein